MHPSSSSAHHGMFFLDPVTEMHRFEIFLQRWVPLYFLFLLKKTNHYGNEMNVCTLISITIGFFCMYESTYNHVCMRVHTMYVWEYIQSCMYESTYNHQHMLYTYIHTCIHTHTWTSSSCNTRMPPSAVCDAISTLSWLTFETWFVHIYLCKHMCRTYMPFQHFHRSLSRPDMCIYISMWTYVSQIYAISALSWLTLRPDLCI
jgi:hypothetical protein